MHSTVRLVLLVLFAVGALSPVASAVGPAPAVQGPAAAVAARRAAVSPCPTSWCDPGFNACLVAPIIRANVTPPGGGNGGKVLNR